jgi:hypothetical protein
MRFKNFYTIFREEYTSEINLDRAYDLFSKEYIQSTGKTWDKYKFLERAKNWKFFGDQNGYVALRPQRSGFYKLVGTAGSDKSKYKGFLEIKSQKLPIWGMVTKNIANILIKKGFRYPTEEELILLKLNLENSGILGNAKITEYLPDGGIRINYPDVGETEKYFVGSPEYWDFLYKNFKTEQ